MIFKCCLVLAVLVTMVALSEAQTTPDVSRFITVLGGVQTIVPGSVLTVADRQALVARFPAVMYNYFAAFCAAGPPQS